MKSGRQVNNFTNLQIYMGSSNAQHSKNSVTRTALFRTINCYNLNLLITDPNRVIDLD